MTTSNYEALCHKVLAALNAKTNNQAYYIGEADLADWYVPMKDLQQTAKSDLDELQKVISLMQEGDQIGVITKDGREHFYLKIKGIVAIEEKKYTKTNSMLSQFKRIIHMW